MLIVLEIVPSNYSLFKIQDDPDWHRSVGAQSFATIFLAATLVFSFGKLSNVFEAYSSWMTVYAGTMAIRRYMDITLQSSGRLQIYLRYECLTSILRLVLLLLCLGFKVEANTAIWLSLVLATLASQSLWMIRNLSEFHMLFTVRQGRAWASLSLNAKEYPKYYTGIILKRLKDSLIPIVAARLFENREVLAAFFLAYRGLLFASSQVRILEAMLNYRGALAVAEKLSMRHRIFLASLAQLLCLAASAGLLISSGLDHLPWGTSIALSFVIWPVVFLVLERAKAYSSFQAWRVNFSIFSYIFTVLIGSALFCLSGLGSPVYFSIILVSAEFVGLLAISRKIS